MINFHKACDSITQEGNRNKHISDENKILLNHFESLSESEKLEWILDSKQAVLKGEDAYYGYGAHVLARSMAGKKFLLDALKFHRSEKPSNWIVTILIILLNVKYPPLANEEVLISEILKNENDLIKLQTAVRYVLLNSKYSINLLCSLLVEEEKIDVVLNNYAHYIISKFSAAGEENLHELNQCLEKKNPEVAMKFFKYQKNKP